MKRLQPFDGAGQAVILLMLNESDDEVIATQRRCHEKPKLVSLKIKQPLRNSL
jgi:hypothetical protein